MDNANIQTQQMLAKGGFAAGGMNKDPVSGNEVPPGALPHEVRDDVPAQLSEGEFVVPASVVRFIGLDRLMKMRDKAIEGLKRMETIGQMGNSEEAAQNGENPLGQFDEEDDDGFESEIDDIMGNGEVEMATGGSVPGKSATGQDMSGWLWDNQAKDAYYSKTRPKEAGLQRWQGVAPEIVKYLQAAGYEGVIPTDEYLQNYELNQFITGTHPSGFEGGRNDDGSVAGTQAGVDYSQFSRNPEELNNELTTWLADKGLSMEYGIHQTPGATQMTQIQRLVGADGKPVAVDAHNNRYSASDRGHDIARAIAVLGSAYVGGVAAGGGVTGGATSGFIGGTGGALSGGAEPGDALKAGVKGAVSGAIGAGLGQLGGKAYDFLASNNYLPEGLVNAVDDTTGAIKGIPGKIGSQMKDVFGTASTVADTASAVNAAGNTVLPTVTTVGTSAPGLAATIGSGIGAAGAGAAIGASTPTQLDKVEITGPKDKPVDTNTVLPGVGGAVSGVVPDAKFETVTVKGPKPDNKGDVVSGVGGAASGVVPDVVLDKVEIVGEKKPPKDDSDIPPYGPIDVTPAPVTPVPDKLPDVPPKDSKTKLPGKDFLKNLIGAGVVAGGLAAASKDSSTPRTRTAIPRGNNPVVDYRPVDAQTEQLFINNRPTGKMKKRNMAVGGDVNLDAYDFFKHG